MVPNHQEEETFHRLCNCLENMTVDLHQSELAQRLERDMEMFDLPALFNR